MDDIICDVCLQLVYDGKTKMHMKCTCNISFLLPAEGLKFEGGVVNYIEKQGWPWQNFNSEPAHNISLF